MIKVKPKNYNTGDDGYFLHGMENASFDTILAPFKEVRRVYRHHQHPDNVSLVYLRNILRLMGHWPHPWRGEYLYYKILNKFAHGIVGCLGLSITFDLYESSNDFILFGDDLVLIIGIYMVFFKMLLYVRNAKEIEYIIGEFNRMHYYFGFLRKSPGLKEIRKLQRDYFLFELIMSFIFVILVILFSTASVVPPLFMETIPYRSKLGFEWHPFKEYPIRFTCVYIFQFFTTFFGLICLVFIDGLGCHIFTQTTLNLKIFCIRLRELGTMPGVDPLEDIREAIQFHQYIINLIAKINEIYHSNYVAQMVHSTSTICLAAFEAMLASDEPLVAIRFQMHMVSAFAQLFYWCACGNMVYYTSVEVADAVFDIPNWNDQSDEFKCCVKLLLQRAQKPLFFQPKPFPAFTFQTLTNILRTSYSYYTVLRTMLD